jgi:hypothetical protein
MKHCISKCSGILLLFALAFGLFASGCGAADHGEEAVVIQETGYSPPTALAVRQLRQCLVHHGLHLRKRAKAGWESPITGVLPAEEVGFVVLPGGGAVDLWLTRSPREAERVSRLANQHYRRKGVGNSENDAQAHGSGVTTVVVTEALPVRHGELAKVYRCF